MVKQIYRELEDAGEINIHSQLLVLFSFASLSLDLFLTLTILTPPIETKETLMTTTTPKKDPQKRPPKKMATWHPKPHIQKILKL